MSGEIPITVVGNLTTDPELRFTQSGAAVSNFTVASTPSRYDKSTGAWVDGETSFLRCNAWRNLGENIAESLRKGDRVIVSGTIAMRTWETPEGDTRSTWECTANACGPDLQFRGAKVQPKVRADTPPPPDDPWAVESEPEAKAKPKRTARGRKSFKAVPADEPPF